MRNLKLLRRRSLLHAGGFLCLMVLFQNCNFAPMKFVSSENPLFDPKIHDNGQGYAGLQKGEYFQLVPDFTCEQKEAPVAQISVSDSGIQLTENKMLACGAIKKTLDPKWLDQSIYQKEIIGYQEGIFEGLTSTPTTIPANLVEIWCRDRNDQQGIESITYYDRISKLAVNRIYYSALDTDGNQTDKMLRDFPVARLVGAKSILVKDDMGFELHVYRDKPASKLGLFVGQMKAMIEGKNITRETYCRLGGSVAPSVWPAKQIVDISVWNFKTSPEGRDFAYASTTINGISNLYSSPIDGSRSLRAAPEMLGSGVREFLFTPDSKSLIYNGDPRLKYASEMYRVNLDGSEHQHLSETLTTTYQSAGSKFKLSPDGQSLLYLDTAYNMSASWGNPWLKVVPLTGGAPVILNLPYTGGNDSRVNSFDISRTQNRVAYFSGSFYSDTSKISDIGTSFFSEVYSANLDGSDIKKITPPSIKVPLLPNILMDPSDWVLDWYQEMVIPNGGNFALVQAHNFSRDFKFYAIAIDGSGSIELPLNWTWKFSSLSGDFGLLQEMPFKAQNKQVIKSKLLNFKTQATMDLPLIQFTHGPNSPTFFNKDSSALIGSELREDGQYQPIAIATNDGSLTQLCPGLHSHQIRIQELSEKTLLILSYEQSTQILNVYLKSGSSICSKVNSVSIGNSTIDTIHEMMISPDKQKILVNLSIATRDQNGSVTNISSSQLLYIPLNGKPPLLINTPVYETARIKQSLFSWDSQSVLYIGDQIKPGEFTIFRWTSPP